MPDQLDPDVDEVDPDVPVTDGVITFQQPDTDSPIVIDIDGLQPGTTLLLFGTLQQLEGEFELSSDAFSSESGFAPGFGSPGRRPFNPGVLRSSGVNGVETELGVVIERSRARELSRLPRGASVVGAITVSLTYDELLAALGDTVGLPGTPLTRADIDAVLARGLTPYDIFPGLDADDPLLTETTDWLVVDVVVADAHPGSTARQVWFSDPLIAAAALVAGDGDAAFQVYIPNTAIAAGEVDRLRSYTTYLLDEVPVDADGRASTTIILPDDLREIIEPGSNVVIEAVGIDPDGTVRSLSVSVPADSLGRPESSSTTASNVWLTIPVAAVVALIIFFIARRRRAGGDPGDDPGDDSGDPDDVSRTPEPA